MPPPSGIPADLMRRLAALDAVCDYCFERREWSDTERAGRTFRYWRVVIGPRGCDLSPPKPDFAAMLKPNAPSAGYAGCEAARLVDAIEGAVRLAEQRFGKGKAA